MWPLHTLTYGTAQPQVDSSIAPGGVQPNTRLHKAEAAPSKHHFDVSTLASQLLTKGGHSLFPHHLLLGCLGGALTRHK
jgi:hypothetical protein